MYSHYKHVNVIELHIYQQQTQKQKMLKEKFLFLYAPLCLD